MVERTKGRRPKNRPCDTKGRRPKNRPAKGGTLEATWVRGKGTREPWRRGATDFLQVVAATACATLNCQLGFLVFSSGRQLDFSLRVWGPLHSSPARSFMILWPSAESTAVLRVPISTHSRHLVTSRRVRAQVSGSRRTARAPAECPRVCCLSLCPARILAVLECPHLDSSVWRVRATLRQASWLDFRPVSSA